MLLRNKVLLMFCKENITEGSVKRVFIVFESESNSEVPLWFQVKPELSMGFPYGSTFISHGIKINQIDQFSLSLSQTIRKDSSNWPVFNIIWFNF